MNIEGIKFCLYLTFGGFKTSLSEMQSIIYQSLNKRKKKKTAAHKKRGIFFYLSYQMYPPKSDLNDILPIKNSKCIRLRREFTFQTDYLSLFYIIDLETKNRCIFCFIFK